MVKYKKLTKVKNLPINGKITGSIMGKTYEKVMAGLREQAKKEHKKLITNDGIEDYTN